MACKYKYKDKWYSESEVKIQIFRNISLNEVIVELTTQMSYTIEINTAKTEYEQTKSSNPFEAQYNFLPITEEEFIEKINIAKEQGIEINRDDRVVSFTIDNVDYQYIDGEFEAWDKNKEKIKKGENTQYYSSLTVPGGTAYTENEISTPLITPSIKGHAAFSTDSGIGWFRSDEKQNYTEQDVDSLIDNMIKSGILQKNCS